MRLKRKLDWWPHPKGMNELLFITPVWLLFFIYSIINQDVLYGVLSLLYGGWAVYSVGMTAYTVGMRRGAREVHERQGGYE